VDVVQTVLATNSKFDAISCSSYPPLAARLILVKLSSCKNKTPTVHTSSNNFWTEIEPWFQKRGNELPCSQSKTKMDFFVETSFNAMQKKTTDNGKQQTCQKVHHCSKEPSTK